MHSRPRSTRRAASQAGFAMVAVFLIMIAMIGAAVSILLNTRANIRSSGQSREKIVARYVAEAGLARAKSLATSRWSSLNRWGDLLTAPPVEVGVYHDFNFGGVNGLPMVRARYSFNFVDNQGDPDDLPLTDLDGHMTIMVRGELLDPVAATPTILAITLLEIEVYKEDVAVSSQGYTAQAHGGSSQASYSGVDAGTVNLNTSTAF
ncbi:MAG: hypothetical protein CVU65_04205 [Deltaproteobacteria bacterium HGW-Deltaproteobacteria-22]|jgi:hypothetical protein|nr:MAG: hypothetical protein CVU65_04205 [Deltaproteobacteria bacterium HGW-Deltaproteobacteria-22]